ncbi:MAG: hypothetical protein AAFS10_01635, partial [Myxococcota bacterium]
MSSGATTRLKLRKILGTPHAPELLRSFCAGLGSPMVQITDPNQKLLWGVAQATCPFTCPITYEGTVLGHLRTDTEAKLEPLAALVQFMVSEEANKKALVAEVLDAYRENALLHKLSRTLASSLQSQRV